MSNPDPLIEELIRQSEEAQEQLAQIIKALQNIATVITMKNFH